MANNVRLALKAVLSTNTDYTAPNSQIRALEWTGTPTEFRGPSVQSVGTSSETLVAANALASASLIYVRNLDATNFVTLIFSNDAGSVTHKLAAGGTDFICTTDVVSTAAVTCTADTAACLVEFFLLS